MYKVTKAIKGKIVSDNSYSVYNQAYEEFIRLNKYIPDHIEINIRVYDTKFKKNLLTYSYNI